MRVVFMGTPPYADEILKTLLLQNDIEITGVYTQPDKPVGRKHVITPSAVKITAKKYNLDIYQPNNLRDISSINEFLNLKCDYVIVAAYGQILPQQILNHAPCINLHASILPKYRGASPIQEAILNDDKQTGVTAMKMDKGLDTGDIIKISSTFIKPDEMVQSLYDRLTKIACKLAVDVLHNYHSYTPIAQDNLTASYCGKITKQDGLVDFDNAMTIHNKYRAFGSWPGIYLQSGLKLKSLDLYETARIHNKGQILAVEDKYIIVGCKRGSVKIYKVQPVSKREMDIISYINGRRLGCEDYLS